MILQLLVVFFIPLSLYAQTPPPTLPSLRLDLINSLKPEAPSVRVWKLTSTQEKIQIYVTSNCSGTELIKKSFSSNNLKGSRDIHLSADDFPEFKTYTLSVKSDKASCSNSINYKKINISAPNIIFSLNGPNQGNTSQIKFMIQNSKRGDIVSIHQNDATCTTNQIKTMTSEGLNLFTTESLLLGDSSPNSPYSFYAQAKRGSINGPCVGPVTYYYNKSPPNKAELNYLEKGTTPYKIRTGFNRTPLFSISNFQLGNVAELILGSNCSGRIIDRIEKKDAAVSSTFNFKKEHSLSVDQLYIFSAKVTDPQKNSSCSNEVKYTLLTEIPDPRIKLIVDPQTSANIEDSPTFKIENVFPNDKVTIYKDKYCSKIKQVSEEKTIGAGQNSIEVKINPLKKAEVNNFYVKVFSDAFQNTKCSSVGVRYKYRPISTGIPNIDPFYDYVDTEEGSDSGTTTPTDPKVIEENERILGLGSNLEFQAVNNFYVSEIGYNEIEVIKRTPDIKETLDSSAYKDAEKKPWLNTETDQLIPYVKKDDKTFISIGGHTVNRILYNLQTQYPANYPDVKTYSRIVRDYTQLKYTDAEIQKDMINSGFVWLHNLSKTQNIFLNQKSYNGGDSNTLGQVQDSSFCDRSVNDLILNTKDSYYYCVTGFDPSKLYTETYSNVISKKTKDMTSDPYLSIVYFLKNGMNPYEIEPQKNLSLAPFYKIGVTTGFPSNPDALENLIVDYIQKLMTEPQYRFQDSKWALYLKYRLQRDWGVTFSSLKADLDAYKNRTSTSTNKEFGRNVCRAITVLRDTETKLIYKKYSRDLPGFKWRSETEVPDRPEWCDSYGDSLKINNIKYVSPN
jgi:hypothetical protein